jgi:hypothetical protein
MKNLLFIIPGVVLLVILLKFGTVSPCGIMREQIRQEAAREGEFGSFLAAAMPDAAIDGILIAQYGSLSPGRCIVLALTGPPLQAPAAPPPSPPERQQTYPQTYQPGGATMSQPLVDALKQAGALANTAINDCKNRRLSGELKTYAASAQCSNPKIIKAYQNSRYRYMDLIALITAKRLQLSKEIDNGKMTEAQEQLAFARFMTEITDRERQRDSKP